MKNKKSLIYIIFTISLIIISSSIQANNKNINKINLSTNTINVNHLFSTPIIEENFNGNTIHLDNTNNYSIIPGQPILPISTKIIELPLGTRVTDIICTITDVKEYQTTKDVVPGIQIISFLDSKSSPQLKKDSSIYQNDNFFPENWYNIRTSSGLNRFNQHTTFLSIQFNPIRYNPIKKTVLSVKSINLEIKVEEPNISRFF